MCEFNDCQDYHTEVSIVYRGERGLFCCVDHAVLWLLQQEYPNIKRIMVEERSPVVN